MSVNSYNPNSPATVNALTQAQLLNARIESLIEKLQKSKSELSTFIKLASTGAIISTLSAPRTETIEEAAYALRGAQAIGDEAYMTSTAIKSCTETYNNFCRLDLKKVA